MENKLVRTTTETWCGGKMIHREETPWRVEPNDYKIKIDDDPNLVKHDVRCPCCGITVRKHVD